MADCGGFRHYEQSLRVVERLEKDGRGLNLTYEVRDGIVRHTVDPPAATLEGESCEDSRQGGVHKPRC